MNLNDTIYVTGHTGLVGNAICRALKEKGFTDIWTANRKALNLLEYRDVLFFFQECKPRYVFHCAAMVGGIADNIETPAEFITTNLLIDSNVFRAAHRTGVSKLLFMSSAACYPMDATSPLSPEQLMTGPLDETKSGYAMGKLASMQMCKSFRKQYKSDFISVIPNNIYGPGDKSSHVIPSLIRKFDEGYRNSCLINCWGSGNARREFIFSEDVADACIFLMDNYSGPEPVNIGANRDYSIRELTKIISDVVGFRVENEAHIVWDTRKPEGTLQRLLDCSVLYGFGWRPKTCLLDGISKTYQAFLKS